MNAVVTAPLPYDAVRHFLHRFERPARLLVAVSGGSDSTGLLVLIHRILQQDRLSHLSLAAATVDHALRPEAALEAQKVAHLCHTLGIPHVIRRWEDEKPATGVSAAAREARYTLLANAATALRADVILTGHTRDDQAETIAMRSARGNSHDNVGLAGMADATLFDRRIWIMRPLLACRRADIRDILRRDGIHWVDDPSNEDPKYERVRVRRFLAEDDDTQVDTEVGARRRRLASEAAALIARHATCHAAAIVRLAPETSEEREDILRHAFAALVAVAGGRPRLPGHDAMDRVMNFVMGRTADRMTVARALLVRRREGIFIMRERRDIMSLSVPIGAAMTWDGRFHILNKSRTTITVGAGVAEAPSSALFGLPPSLQRHALHVLPHVIEENGFAPTAGEAVKGVEIEPALAPYDRFLPGFDLALANALAALVGRKTYLTPLV